jgi:hypothetical protein
MLTATAPRFTIEQLIELGFTRREMKHPKRVWFFLTFSRSDMPDNEIQLEISDEGGVFLLVGNEYTKISVRISSIETIKQLILILKSAHNCPKTTLKSESYITSR